MPGRLLRLSPERAVGWAQHPRLPEYRVVVNITHRAAVVGSVLAETALHEEQTGAAAVNSGFIVDFGALGLPALDPAQVRLRIGETDEWLAPPDGAAGEPGSRLTVEDILVLAHLRRPWVHGATYRDAEAAGFDCETIIELLYRDYLGRPADCNGLAHYASALRAGTASYDDVRRSFIECDEYRLRAKHLDNAPGTIFSQGIVLPRASPEEGSLPPETIDALGGRLLSA